MIGLYPFVVPDPFKEKHILFYYTAKYPCHAIIYAGKKDQDSEGE